MERVIFNLSYGVVTRADGWFKIVANMKELSLTFHMELYQALVGDQAKVIFYENKNKYATPSQLQLSMIIGALLTVDK